MAVLQALEQVYAKAIQPYGGFCSGRFTQAALQLLQFGERELANGRIGRLVP